MAVVFIDKAVSGFESLYDELSQNNEVYLLDSYQDPFWQISTIVGSKTNLGSIHVFSHGEPGILSFSYGSISSSTIEESKQYLKSIGNSLGPNGDILLYGCNVAEGNEGLKFLKLFSELSKSNVAGSDDRSGPNNLNADWDLEVTSSGTIKSASITPVSFSGTLGTPSISNLDNPLTYTENAALAVLDNNIAISGGLAGGDKYEGGWIEFSLNTATSNDFLKFTDDGSVSTVNGQVSIVDSVLYVGNGTGAAILGNIDSAKTGLAGKALRVNISNKFQNGDFEANDGSSQFENWQIQSGPIYFGTTKIGGLNTPTDITAPAVGKSVSDQNVPTQAGSYSGAVNDEGGGNESVKLTSGSPTAIIAKAGYDIVRGPALYSDNTVFLRSGDKVSFDWKASGGQDAFDVYGYIVNVDNNNFVTILDDTGNSSSRKNTAWATETVTVSAEGSYRFVFVAGTYDFSGGKWAGAQLFVDNVKVTESVVPPAITDAMVQSIARKVKYESTSEDPVNSKILTVKATSITGSGAEKTGTATSTINFTKTNDAPTITSAANTSANENLVNTTVVYDANASDLDASDTLTFSISGTDAALFNLDSDDGEVRLKTSADYENKNTYQFTITVTDNGVGSLSASKVITLNINDLNDPPAISSAATGSIAENAAISTIAYAAAASDPDTGDTITFSLAGTDASFFDIDSDDGEIRLKTAANFEVKNSYSVDILATDSGSSPASASKTVTINITDQNDSPVAIDDSAITTLNTAKNNIVVLDDDTDEDSDTLNIQSIAYSGAGTVSHNGTTINYSPPTGVPTLTETITYVVSDGNGGTDNGSLTMKVITPLIQGPSNPAGSDSSAINKNENITAVTTMTANIPVTWSINAGLDGAKFSIDAGGNLTFNSIPNFEIPTDSDTNNIYQVEIKAVEGGGVSATQILTVTVQNVNEANPVIDTSNLTGTVQENSLNSTVIYTVSASDADTTDVLSYSISGTDFSLINIDSDDGEIRLKTSADFEAKSSYSFNVIVTDPDGSKDTEAVTVSVSDANEAPAITSASTATLAENSSTSTVAYTGVATDVDAGNNITFSLSGTDGYLMTIDADDGKVRLTAPADYETKSTYNFKVIATDDGAGSLSSTKEIVLNISNVNDKPVLSKAKDDWLISEGFISKVDLSEIFSDPDDDLLTLSARLVSGAVLPAWINFDNTSNILTANPSRSEVGDTEIEIMANDGNGGQTSNKLNVNVAVMNSNPTGGVSLEGSGTLGATLTANTINIHDSDGVGPFKFEWYRSGVKITGENLDNYTISKLDVWNKIKVKVSYTDKLGNLEELTSKEIKVNIESINLAAGLEGEKTVFQDAFSQIVIKGSSGDDVVVATGGDSSVDGGAGSDIIIGGTGNNPLNGNIDSDFLIGDLLLSEYFLGNDTLEGGPGNDLIEGGNGVDTFVFSPLDGSDIIAKFNIDFGQINKSTPVGKDFEPGTDKVNLISFGFTSFEEVMSKFSSNTEGHAQFSYQENTILFYGVTIDQLSVADFILV